MIVKGMALDYNVHFKVIFAKFVQTYESTKNDIMPHTIDTIALGPNSNLQGSIRCFSLVTGKIL